VPVEQAAGWRVCVVATEKALHWFDAAAVERETGHGIQSRMRLYGEPLFEPLGDRIVVAPASFNTINRIALGLADDMAAGLVCEAIGRRVPVTIEPQLGPAFANHPAFARSVNTLTECGVRFVWHDPSIRPG
jgi:phosphopantothenoylcysteine synthetase/decarboxylase